MPWWGAERGERSEEEVSEGHLSCGGGGKVGTEPGRREEERAQGTRGRGSEEPMNGVKVGRDVYEDPRLRFYMRGYYFSGTLDRTRDHEEGDGRETKSYKTREKAGEKEWSRGKS